MVRPPEHLPGLASCPFLPEIEAPLKAAEMRVFGKTERGPDFYRRALECAQSLWLQGLPAQSLLQINRAMGADLAGDEPVLAEWPLPYAAADWVMRHRRAEDFIGNPRRHYQHLATRMVGPRKTQRSWRAWACWALACEIFPVDDYPADEKQIREEGVVEPSHEAIGLGLKEFGAPGEAEVWMACWQAGRFSPDSANGR